MPYWFDGNNLTGQTAAAAASDRATRRAFLKLLGDYVAARGGRFVVFFDGDDPERKIPPRGVQVRFSAPLSADDAILRDLKGNRTPSEIIVVTNDHALQTRCRDEGAKTMNWERFTCAMKNKPHLPGKRVTREEEIELEEWLEFFGLDENSVK